MLPTFNMTGKNVTPERQMAMMRTYLNELKDNTESELYDIKWENLSKPLREKIDSLESYQASNDEMVNYIKANSITANDITANFIASRLFVGEDAKFVNAVSDKFKSAIADIGYLKASTINADYIYGLEGFVYKLQTTNLSADYIKSGTLSSNYISTSIMRTSDFTAANIAAKFTSSVLSEFDYLRAEDIKISGSIRFDDEGQIAVGFKPMTINVNGTNHRVLGRY